jgi:murein DD-endopeptidase MepM/ murein hydrolase activator NlpD
LRFPRRLAQATLFVLIALAATMPFAQPALVIADVGAVAAQHAANGGIRVGAAEVAPAGNDDSVALLKSRRLIVPIAGIPRASLRDAFKDARGANRHEALDIIAPRGTPVVAVGDGRVVKLFDSVAGGHVLYQFDPDDKFAYYYAHLESYARGLKEGMPVKRGDLLGYVGSTGNATTGAPHLHFAIFRLGPERHWWQGTPVNPYGLLNDPQP